MAQREFTQIFPQPGWVEHDAREIWATQHAVALEAIEAVGAGHPASPASASPTSAKPRCCGTAPPAQPVAQRHRLAGPPHGAALRRTARARATRRAMQQKTGLVIDAYFSGTKLEWLLDHVPGARRRAERGELAFGTVDSWLVWNLTGRPRACHRRQQCLAHPAVQPAHAGLGRRAAGAAARAARGAAAGGAFQRRGRRDRSPRCSAARCRSPASPATSRPPPSARPASRPAWPRTPTAPAASC